MPEKYKEHRHRELREPQLQEFVVTLSLKFSPGRKMTETRVREFLEETLAATVISVKDMTTKVGRKKR
jgi:hypothetical protein